MIRRAAVALAALATLAAACARSNVAILEELEAEAARHPRPERDALLERPIGAVGLRDGRPETTLPLRPGKLAVVEGEVNGVALPLVLDTGTSGVVLSGAAARSAGVYLPPGAVFDTISPGHHWRQRLGTFESLRVGEQAFGAGVCSVPVHRAPLPGLGRTYVIVGCTVLGHYRVTLDFRDRTATLARHGLATQAAPMITRVGIQDREYWLLVDSGASRVLLEPWAALELGLVDAEQAARLETKAQRPGWRRLPRHTLARVTVAGRRFHDVDAAIVHTYGGGPDARGRRFAGLLGLSGFGPLAWTIDFGRRQLTVSEPVPHRAATEE